MGAKAPGGFDAAQRDRQEDDLDRWRFARDVVEVVSTTSPEWSVRIGIFGKWGEGKTTVLRFAEDMLKAKGNIVFTFSPWAVQGWDNLWQDFGSLLVEALSAADIPCEGFLKKTVKESSEFLQEIGVTRVAEGAAAFFGKEKLYNIAFGAVSQWLKYDGPQVLAIRAKLKDRRLVVLIDDLDRCAPELLPQLLLSLRELLDLPGFTFLLAFDDEIVAGALAESNPAWKSGTVFLEKILDFRFHLSPITEVQKERLVARAITKYCDFVPVASVSEILDLLPNNPRKVKSLIRSMAALRFQVKRHDADELNWVDMWLAQMLRLESYSFFETLLRDNTLDAQVGVLYKLTNERSGRGWKSNDEEKNKSLIAVIEEAGITDSVTKKRLVLLIEAIRSRATSKFPYACELAYRPHAVTWREFRSFYATWARDREAGVMTRWIEEHAANVGASAADVETELFETMVMRRNECLMQAADEKLVEHLDSSIKEATFLLQLMEQNLLDLGKLSAERFNKLYGQCSSWIGFRKNASDKEMRDKEETCLLRIVGSASEQMSTELLQYLAPQHSFPELGEGFVERKALREKCLSVVSFKAAKEAIAFLRREGGIRLLQEQGRFPGVKYCLFNPNSSVWNSSLRTELLELIEGSANDSVLYENVGDFFGLLIGGLERKVDFIAKQDVELILSDHSFAQSLWNAVTSRPIQYRMQIAFLRDRRTLVEIGVPEEMLPLTKELDARSSEWKTETA